jgi:hypothetical protein
MNTYKRHRFRLGAPHTWAPPDLISYAVWLYYRFKLRRAVAATEMSRIYWLSEASQSPASQSASGASSLVLCTLEG